MDSGIECTLRKFTDTAKLKGTVDILKRNAIQMDIEKWASVSFTKLNMARY